MSGWLAALVMVAAGMVFVPFGLYVWASSGPEPPRPVAEDVAVTGCRIDPASRRVVAGVEVVSRTARPGRYVVTVEFRRGEAGNDVPVQAVVKLAAVHPGEVGHAEAVGPVWPAGVIPWCGIAGVDLSREAKPSQADKPSRAANISPSGV
ncbi:hypothetical protein OHS33_23180 [Streptomyces sp. NBC_00536]|uniref:hypothetical protein n=1 Tax=Streptomyces sp. NBC_00536 TaxID=2975769 RepID=UPI002E814271|nr:hypothetical protein [Streptomyces sp. NBC_00536]WUC80982.1 hypothetical protein OHS33_23180 [Streptomyces sp. NBC_00536]